MSEGLNVEFGVNASREELSYYSRCYAVLFSAINEDWGLIPLEAMASSKPCISVNEGGPKYSILHDQTGYLIENPQEMADRMGLLAEYPDIVEKMGRAGRWSLITIRGEYFWREWKKNSEKSPEADYDIFL